MAGGQGQCDRRVEREEDEGEDETGGEIMPDLVGCVK